MPRTKVLVFFGLTILLAGAVAGLWLWRVELVLLASAVVGERLAAAWLGRGSEVARRATGSVGALGRRSRIGPSEATPRLPAGLVR